jgi:hypothetical protein
VRRWSTVVLVAITLLWRILPAAMDTRSGADGEIADGATLGVATFLNADDLPWVGSPLFLGVAALDGSIGADGWLVRGVALVASLLLVLGLARIGERWLDFPSGRVGAALIALSALTVASALLPAPALLMAAGSVLYADRLQSTAYHRDPTTAWRMGMACGVLTWIGGLGALWLLATLLWLPSCSRHFRGLPGLRFAGVLLLGWLLVLSPMLAHGVARERGLSLPFLGASADLLAGLRVEEASPVSDLGNRDPRQWTAYADSLLQEAGSAPVEGTWARSRALLQTALLEIGERPLRSLAHVGQRALGFWSASVEVPGLALVHGQDVPALPALPAGWILSLSWLGLIALLPSLQSYFPLYLGVLLPLSQAAVTGLGPADQLVGLPFLALFVGYGLSRIWSGRHHVGTWLLAIPALGWGILLSYWITAR